MVLNPQVLERQIRTRDGAAVATNFAVQSLDHKYIQGLGDLRGRVARYGMHIMVLFSVNSCTADSEWA